jgi:hypothetical protein
MAQPGRITNRRRGRRGVARRGCGGGCGFGRYIHGTAPLSVVFPRPGGRRRQRGRADVGSHRLVVAGFAPLVRAARRRRRAGKRPEGPVSADPPPDPRPHRFHAAAHRRVVRRRPAATDERRLSTGTSQTGRVPQHSGDGAAGLSRIRPIRPRVVCPCRRRTSAVAPGRRFGADGPLDRHATRQSLVPEAARPDPI